MAPKSPIPHPIALGSVTISVILPSEDPLPTPVLASTIFLSIPGLAVQEIAKGLPSSEMRYGFLAHSMVCILGVPGVLVHETSLQPCPLDEKVALPATLRFDLNDPDSDIRQTMIPSSELNQSGTATFLGTSLPDSMSSCIGEDESPAPSYPLLKALESGLECTGSDLNIKTLRTHLRDRVKSRDQFCRYTNAVADDADATRLFKACNPNANLMHALIARKDLYPTEDPSSYLENGVWDT